MKKLKDIVKKNYKLVIILILGVTLLGTAGVYAATYINAENVAYSNSSSGLSATNMQDALDEAYQKTELKNRDNIVEAYTYNQTSGATNYCVTGEESTCVETTCYESTTAGSCSKGTIIKYKVNASDVVTFHVMYDRGTTMTMQSQRNIVYTTPWMSSGDYEEENTDSTSCSDSSCTDEGPITILKALERATQSWINVNDQTYTMGTTSLPSVRYTGCSAYNTCTVNTYTLDSRTAKARLITLNESITAGGCTTTSGTCNIWMYNYLGNSTGYGGTANDTNMGPNGSYNWGYWTMNAHSSFGSVAWYVSLDGLVGYNYAYNPSHSARAVVEVSK